MRLKNVLIVVKDMDRSKAFYKELFGLDVILDQDGNVILTEGLVLQDAAIWEKCIGKQVIQPHHASELYFEETDLDGFIRKLENRKEPIRYVNRPQAHSGGKRSVCFYDPDGNLIEVGMP